MELITPLLFIGSVGYMIYILFLDTEDETIHRRISEFSPVNLKQKDEDVDKDSSVEFVKENLNKLAQNVARKSKNLITQKQMLMEAGMAGDDDSIIQHISKKLLFAGIGGLCGLFLVATSSSSAMIKMMIIIMFPMVGFRLPDMALKKKVKFRSEQVNYTLPDSIDLLSVCVEAGLGLDSAVTRVAQEQEKTAPVLSEELKKVGKDILAGVPRADAFKNLAKRNGSQELRSFVSLLVQSDKLGTSISNALKVYAETLRTKRKQKAEQQAAQASIKMTIPLVLFILPATFIVILAPAALSIMKVFMNGGPGGP